MNSILSKYSAALLPLGVLIVGVFTAADKAGTNLLGWQTVLQLVILLATTASSFWLRLVPGKWAGAAKTGAGIVGAVASALIAVVPDGHFTQSTFLLFLTAVFHAVATQLGVTIRVSEKPVADQLPAVTSSDLVPFDEVAQVADDAPKHAAF